jgi:23S rRNA C2498 (ribose-2'-O)-methylase RlmM
MNTIGGSIMNTEFKQWLEKQEYAYNPTPRERGWLIHSVVTSKYGTAFIIWKWEAIYPTLKII